MPPTKKDQSASSQAVHSSPSHHSTDKRTVDDLIEALLDPRVAAAIIKLMDPSIDEALKRHLAPIRLELRELKSATERFEKERTALEGKISSVVAVNVELERRLEELERYSRRDNLIISGLPEGSYAEAGTSSTATSTSNHPTESSTTTERVVHKFLTDTMGLDVQPGDITIAHRLKKGKSDNTRPIIVRLVNKRVRDSILRAKKSLRNTPNSNIFISEHLTQAASKLLFEARRLVRGKKIASAWTQNGRVFFKYKLEDVVGIMAKSVDDLPK